MAPARRQLGHAPDGVPAHFSPRPVRVPHVHAQVGAILAAGAHSHDSVASNARVAAAHAPLLRILLNSRVNSLLQGRKKSKFILKSIFYIYPRNIDYNKQESSSASFRRSQLIRHNELEVKSRFQLILPDQPRGSKMEMLHRAQMKPDIKMFPNTNLIKGRKIRIF